KKYTKTPVETEQTENPGGSGFLPRRLRRFPQKTKYISEAMVCTLNMFLSIIKDITWKVPSLSEFWLNSLKPSRKFKKSSEFWLNSLKFLFKLTAKCRYIMKRLSIYVIFVTT